MHFITQNFTDGTATCSCGQAFGTRHFIRSVLAHVKGQGGYMHSRLVLALAGIGLVILAIVTVVQL